MAIDFVRNIISSGYNLTKINENFANIETALQDSLSRSGNGPNQMSADLDMNSNDILNVGTLSATDFTIAGSPVTAAVQQAVDAAIAAEAARDQALTVAAALPPITPDTMLVDNAAGTARESKTFADVRSSLGVWYKNANYSMPNALDNLVLYVMTTGSDTISDIATHGQTTGTAFLTIDAALNYAKKYWEFHGRMTVLELRVGPGSWGNFATGSNLEQAYDSYPFGIFLTAQDAATPANWPEFDIISIGGFLNKSVYVKNVLAGVFGVTRMNILCVNDVRVKDVGAAYCLYASIKGQLHVFGDVEITEPVSYSSSFIYAQQQGSIALENGDSPLVFPMVNLINPGNITSPSKYRAVFGAFIYCPSNIWPQLTYASTFYTDHTSFSSQTTTGTDAKYNSATGGGSVAWAGTPTTGYEWFADGRLHQWGTVALTSLAAGYTAVAGTITFDTTVPFSSAPRVHLSCNNANINVAKAAGGTAAVTQNVGAYNMGAADQSTTVTWDAWGLM